MMLLGTTWAGNGGKNRKRGCKRGTNEDCGKKRWLAQKKQPHESPGMGGSILERKSNVNMIEGAKIIMTYFGRAPSLS